MKSSLISNSQPRSIAVGDLNNDQQMDLIIANSGRNNIGIYFSRGDGTFADQQTYSTGSESRSYSVVISDFNHDSYTDIAVANYGTNSIGIFLGNGNQTFINHKVISLGPSHPLFVTIGDFNNDHRMDLAVVNYGTNTIGILIGYGNGYFRDQVTYSTEYDSIPQTLAVGDFNNDNQLDIAVANYGTNNIGIFFGYGNGTFANQITYATTLYSNPSSISLNDLNNDNQLDIVVANSGTGNIGVFLGYANGTFSPQVTYPIVKNSHPRYITIGDLNNDYELDIIVVDSANDQIHVLSGHGNGIFANITTYDGIPKSNPFWAAVADFNNDNRLDMAVVNHDTNNVLVLIDYFNKPSARQTNYKMQQGGTPTSVVVSDLNNDHILDIVYNGGSFIHILTGLGDRTFLRGRAYSTGYGSIPQCVCVGHLNNDDRIDIVIADSRLDTVGVFLGHGDGSFANMKAYPTGSGSGPWYIALGDVNNDNRLDIASANPKSQTISILLGNGDGSFNVPKTIFFQGREPYSVAVGYIDNDNNLDLAVTGFNSFVIIFIGLGDGHFIVAHEYSIDQDLGMFSIILADFNIDNRLDIVVTCLHNDNIIIFLGAENGTFPKRIIFNSGSGSIPYRVIAADFNNNNITDIAVTNYNADEVVIFYGYGNGSFEHARTYPTGYGSKPYAIAPADFDDDKQLELVVTFYGSASIAILTEYNAAEFANQTKYLTDAAAQPVSVDIGDLNNDNRPDIVVANSGTGNLSILLGSGNGTFDKEMIYSIGVDSYPQHLIIHDINQDNHLDIISVNSILDSISVIMGYGDGSFAEQLIYPTGNGSHPYAVTADDLNSDDILDLVIANEGTDSIGIYWGFKYVSFQNQKIYLMNVHTTAIAMAVADFDNDNCLDIATALHGMSGIYILFGYCNGSFASFMTYPGGNGERPYGLAVGDFNNDGRLDIVVTNWGVSNIRIFLGYGNRNFTDSGSYSTGTDSLTCGVAVGDLNNDGRMDIVVTNSYNDNIGVLLGYGNGSFFPMTAYPLGYLLHPSVSLSVI